MVRDPKGNEPNVSRPSCSLFVTTSFFPGPNADSRLFEQYDPIEYPTHHHLLLLDVGDHIHGSASPFDG